jgi:hypothetical protein
MHTTISDVHIISLSRHTADLLVDGRPVAVRLPAGAIDPHSRNLVPLPVDPAFYATLRGQQRADYLSAHVRDGVRYGRILWHKLDDGRHFLTIPIIGGYLVERVFEIRRSRDGVWSRLT